MYCEIICFYARAMHFLRTNPHLVLRKNAWQTFRNDFSRTIMRIKRISSSVESEADLARMRKDESQYKEVLELLGAMKMTSTDCVKQIRYNNIPFGTNTKFSGREDVLGTISESLASESATTSLRSVALFGMGGVGKTQIALQYAHRNLDAFEVVLWIAADSAITIGQSCRTIADHLGLLGSDDEVKDAAAAIYKLKGWLNSTSLSPHSTSYSLSHSLSNRRRIRLPRHLRQRGRYQCFEDSMAGYYPRLDTCYNTRFHCCHVPGSEAHISRHTG